MSDMRSKGYRISEAKTWADVISCCRNLARKAPLPTRPGQQLEFYMRPLHGYGDRLVLACRLFVGAVR